jgi:solute carrier family 24 (sodium/potassium/calcium exchanger), member 6
MGVLFSAISIAASEFFCPNLATLSETLRMSQSLAGVTFLAIGNGSPDLFSTFAAMKVGSGSLAIGELIGAAFFITSVVTGSMAIVNPFKVSRRPFLRDAIFFFGAVIFTVGLLAHGKITTWVTSGMIAYYIVYVGVVCFATWYWRKHSRQRHRESRPIDVENHDTTTAYEPTEVLGDERDLESAEPDLAEMEQGYISLQHQMRLLRPSIDGTRIPLLHNHSSIRPSLLGALEVLFKIMRLMTVPILIV